MKTIILRLLLAQCYVVTGLRADSYCSLIVKVESTASQIERAVVVEEENGWKTEYQTVRGQARFCGLGIRPVTVTVGRPGCNQVAEKDVPLNWNETREQRVIYNHSGCQTEQMPVAACSFLLRFVKPDHSPVSGVSFRASAPYPRSYSADEFGRLFVRIGAGQELSGEAAAEGYSIEPIRIQCVSENQWLERIVSLRTNSR